MPPRGSFADRVLVEMVRRERWTQLAEREMEMLAQGMFAGGKGEEVYKGVKELTKEWKSRLFHYGFSSRRLAAKLQHELNELRSNQDRLKKLDAMTV